MASKCRVLKGGYCEITQYYGGSGNHLGIDIVGKNYTIDTVVAHSEGTVIFIQTGQKNNQGSTGNASYGNFVKLSHGKGYFTLYAHLDTVNVKVGDKVKKGQIIGMMGNTGNSYGAHLHFEVYKNNTRTNPLSYLDADLFSTTTNTVSRDENKNQLKVNVNDLRIRKSPSINSEIIGMSLENGIYNYYETKNEDGYNWYKVADNQWLANKDNWCTIYPKKELDLELNEEIQKLKEQIKLLEQENADLKENSSNSVFVAPRSGLYYIELQENEQLVYKKV